MNTWSAGASARQVTNVFLIFTKNIFIFLGARYNCAGTFDERTCECECKGEMFQDMEKVTNLCSKYPPFLKMLPNFRFVTASLEVNGILTTACVNTR